MNKPVELTLGSLRCSVISDGPLAAPASFLFANADPDEVGALLRAGGLDPEAVPAGLNCLLVDLGDLRLLWDVGTGGRWHDGLGGLAAGLERAGVDPGSIDRVVISHGHPDHIGGLLDGAGRLRFPRARYLMSAAEWEHWTDPASLARMEPSWAEVALAVLPAIADRVERTSGEHEIRPGVRLVPSPGHTPGHLALELESEGRWLLAVGDALGHPLNVGRPGWLAASDGDPIQTPATRRALLDRALARDALVFANHFVFPGLGRIRRRAGALSWVPEEAGAYSRSCGSGSCSCGCR